MAADAGGRAEGERVAGLLGLRPLPDEGGLYRQTFADAHSSAIYFLVIAPEHGHVVKTLLAPLLGGAFMLFSAWLLLDNRGSLSGASGAVFIRYGFWLIPIAFAIGVGVALWFRARNADRYAAVGRFVHEDA